MRANLQRDLSRAIKARDATPVAALRSALAAIANAEALDVVADVPSVSANADVAGSPVGLGAGEVERRVVADAEAVAIVRREISERLTAAREYEGLGQQPRADQLRAEAEVLRRYLPGP